MKKHFRHKQNKSGLRAYVAKDDGKFQLTVSWQEASKADCNLLMNALSGMTFSWRGINEPKRDSLLVELLERGYDLSTLDFKCEKIKEGDEEAKEWNAALLKRMRKTQF